MHLHLGTGSSMRRHASQVGLHFKPISEFLFPEISPISFGGLLPRYTAQSGDMDPFEPETRTRERRRDARYGRHSRPIPHVSQLVRSPRASAGAPDRRESDTTCVPLAPFRFLILWRPPLTCPHPLEATTHASSSSGGHHARVLIPWRPRCLRSRERPSRRRPAHRPARAPLHLPGV